MKLSILLTIFTLFLLTYISIMGFALYKVLMFAQNKELKGYSRRISLVFLTIVLSVMVVSFFLIGRYQWDDDVSFWIGKVSPRNTTQVQTNASQTDLNKVKPVVQNIVADNNAVKSGSNTAPADASNASKKTTVNIEENYNNTLFKLLGIK